MVESYNEGFHLLVHGCAGTGKTFMAIYMALCDILSPDSDYDQLVIVRSIVPTRDIGFLPGRADEKEAVYELPYRAICEELFPNDRAAYDRLKKNGVIRFLNTSFIRGTTFRNSIVVVDEVENLNFHEASSVITRAGENTRYILCGDHTQTDLIYNKHDTSGLMTFLRIVERMESFDVIEMTPDDIVRSGLVKEFILAKEEVTANER